MLLTQEVNELDDFNKYYKFIMPPRLQARNLQPPALNRYHRIKRDIITSASLDPFHPLNINHSPPLMPSPSLRVMHIIRDIIFGDTWPKELISKHLCGQISRSNNSGLTSEDNESTKKIYHPF
jgi:hypothetical protein